MMAFGGQAWSGFWDPVHYTNRVVFFFFFFSFLFTLFFLLFGLCVFGPGSSILYPFSSLPLPVFHHCYAVLYII